MTLHRRHRIVAALLALALVAGCGKDKVVDPGPSHVLIADTPANAVRLMAAAFVARDTLIYRGLFTADYVFVVMADTIPGTPTPGNLDWADEMRFARNCFAVGTSQLGPAKTITDTLGTLTALPDARPGKNPTWHREITTGLHLVADALDTVFEVDELLTFYLVRGDSASVTPEIRGTGGPPDTQRWYVERLEPFPLIGRGPNTLERLKLAYVTP